MVLVVCLFELCLLMAFEEFFALSLPRNWM